MSLIGDIFNILKGTWNLQRIITGKQQATASGQGEFLEKSPHHLEYHENMTVQFPEVEHVFSAKTNYLFQAPNRFTIIHNVTGPQKQYTSETLYTRHFYFSNVLSPDVQA